MLVAHLDFDINGDRVRLDGLKNWLNHVPLSIAARKGFKDIVSVLLAHPDVDVNKPDEDNATPLQHAIGHKVNIYIIFILSKYQIQIYNILFFAWL